MVVESFQEQELKESIMLLFDLKNIKNKTLFVKCLKRCASYHEEIFMHNNTKINVKKGKSQKPEEEQ